MQTDTFYDTNSHDLHTTQNETRITIGQSADGYHSRLESFENVEKWGRGHRTRGEAAFEGKQRLDAWLKQHGATSPNQERQWATYRERRIESAMLNGTEEPQKLTAEERAKILKPDMPRNPEQEQRMFRALDEESQEQRSYRKNIKRGVRP